LSVTYGYRIIWLFVFPSSKFSSLNVQDASAVAQLLYLSKIKSKNETSSSKWYYIFLKALKMEHSSLVFFVLLSAFINKCLVKKGKDTFFISLEGGLLRLSRAYNGTRVR
jgi:hypothetical protein